MRDSLQDVIGGTGGSVCPKSMVREPRGMSAVYAGLGPRVVRGPAGEGCVAGRGPPDAPEIGARVRSTCGCGEGSNGEWRIRPGGGVGALRREMVAAEPRDGGGAVGNALAVPDQAGWPAAAGSRVTPAGMELIRAVGTSAAIAGL
ncbi:hypothetical protein Ait01nite_031400 [Actinoplanes italicus]|nr:hypothetical protein Ait01nite_031400 [Actinoplanes italicus]